MNTIEQVLGGMTVTFDTANSQIKFILSERVSVHVCLKSEDVGVAIDGELKVVYCHCKISNLQQVLISAAEISLTI